MSIENQSETLMENSIAHQARELKASGLYRKRVITNLEWINFCSNDYLSLSREPAIIKAYQKGYQKYSSGSRGSMLAGGYQVIHREVEQAFCQFLGVEDALLLASGYSANLALVSLLKAHSAHCLIDKQLHASFYDGLRLAQADFSRYRHNSVEDFAKKMSLLPENSLAITEGIFSMSGQQAPLKKMAEICVDIQRFLLVDEAHSFGLLGREGRGAVESANLNQTVVPLRVIPLGKACAAQGGIIAGKGEWVEALIQTGRSYSYSTGLSPALAYGLLQTLNIVQKAEDRRRKLTLLIEYFRKQITNSALHWTNSVTAIQQLKLGCSHKALWFSEGLQKQGIFCLPMRPPTVSEQNTGLRIVLNYHHEPEHIDLLFHLLQQIENDYSNH